MYKLFACSLITTAVGPAGQLDKCRYAASRLFGNRLPQGHPRATATSTKVCDGIPAPSPWLCLSGWRSSCLNHVIPPVSQATIDFRVVFGRPGYAVTEVTVCPRPWSQSGNQASLIASGPMPATAGQCCPGCQVYVASVSRS